VILLVS